jgi:hypothetical protein
VGGASFLVHCPCLSLREIWQSRGWRYPLLHGHGRALFRDRFLPVVDHMGGGCPRSANRSTWGLVSLKFPFSPLATGLVSASTEQVNAIQREEDKTHLGRASSAIIIHRLSLTSSQRACRILNNPKKARIPNVNVGSPVSNSMGAWCSLRPDDFDGLIYNV